MKLQRITVENFRSIEGEIFPVIEIETAHTYGLIGVNESGKTSFLKAVSLIDEGEVVYPRDFFDDSKPIKIFSTYHLSLSENKELRNYLSEKGFDKDLLSKIEIESIDICVQFEPASNVKRNSIETIKFRKDILENYTLENNLPVKKTGEQQESLDLTKLFENSSSKYFWNISHQITFWKSEDRYLINNQIDLDKFADNPNTVSIPLENCFNLAGINDIKTEINKIKTNPADINNLQEKLGDKVTAHIKKVWPDHPVKIKFQINNMQLSFLIEDDGVRYDAKTTEQRSDGFKQFVSFLLTISAQNSNKLLSNALLLLDEPETHLHPQAQEYLREELIKITQNKENNFVIFATHSNYMIDKDHIDRYFKTTKTENKTSVERIGRQSSSYSEVNFEVFNIATNDYHNELYGFLEDVNPTKLETLPKDQVWFNDKLKKDEQVSLAKYIRHSIHHPENTRNKKFSYTELLKSIAQLRKLKYGK
jgi:predicted ATP-dependent endonuclease of OLD family